MIIIGIHDGHNSSASLMVNGQIIASIQEERMTRVKNEAGFPLLAIRELLRVGEIHEESVDKWIYASNYMHTPKHLKGIDSWYKNTSGPVAKNNTTYLDNFQNSRQRRIANLINEFSVTESKIEFVDHHMAHAATAYFGSNFEFQEEVLVFTCDGAGDEVSATVSIGKNGKLSRISETSRDSSLGKIYSRVTYALGLTPWEHEYKVMGLAPYAHEERAKELVHIYSDLIEIDKESLSFKLKTKIDTNSTYTYFREKFERKRFDDIAASVQIFTENFLTEWIVSAIKKTGIKKIACAGGVFMNVKANMKISELDLVEDIFIFPSCGDESLSFGACWVGHYINTLDSHKKIPLNSLYLGGDFSDSEIEKSISKNKINGARFSVSICDDIEKKIALEIAQNNVIARFSGRMEWGARALGNRSILANPRSWSNIEKINSMIKMRDFWMPFAPSVLSEDANNLISNPKNIYSPYMMFAFRTIPSQREGMSAAIHPRDKTARVQFVEKSQNPNYHKLISYVKELTGVGVVLNTSFNLHGYPLVYTPDEAIYVFLNSGLDTLALGNYLIKKND